MKTIWLFVGLCFWSPFVGAQVGLQRQSDDVAESGTTLTFLPQSILEKLSRMDAVQIAYSQKKEGVVKAMNADGLVVFEAGYKQKKVHGVWKSPTENGNFHMGIPDGRWSFYNEAGAVMAVRDYDAAKWRIAQQEFRHYNPKRGNSLPVAKAVQQGTRLEALLQKQNGDDPFTAPFKAAMLHGTRINYHANGMVADSCVYHHGLRHGDFVRFDENGIKREHGYYHHGDAHGGWTRFDAYGRLLELSTYQHGKLMHQKFYQNGKP